MNKSFAAIYGWPKEKLTDIDAFFKNVFPDEEYRRKMTE